MKEKSTFHSKEHSKSVSIDGRIRSWPEPASLAYLVLCCCSAAACLLESASLAYLAEVAAALLLPGQSQLVLLTWQK